MNNNFYDIEVLNQDGTTQKMEEYRGKILLIVNTATGCGFTPHYEGLEALYKEYKEWGFEVLDFPCNQFANQAKGTDEEINQFCSLKYNTTFKRFKKIEVNGPNKCELFKYLEEHAPYEGKGLKLGFLSKLSKAKDNEIRWNFTKFIVDKDGNVIRRIEPTVEMDEVKKIVDKLFK